MKKFNIILVIVLCSLLQSAASFGEDVTSRVQIACAPREIKPNDWSILVISQTGNIKEADSVSLKETLLESVALFAKVIDIIDYIDGNKLHRIQVYKLRPYPSKKIVLTKSDFKNAENVNIENITIQVSE